MNISKMASMGGKAAAASMTAEQRKVRARTAAQARWGNGPTEKQFQRQVIEFARLQGWSVYHTFDSRRCVAGYPDLTLVHPKRKRLLFLELKTDAGKVRPDQREWLDWLNAAGVTAAVVRPRDWDQIQRELES